jgi:hypothetical protein
MRHRVTHRPLASLALAAVLAAGACGGSRTTTSSSGGEVVPERTLVLEVQNDAFLDQDLFLLAGSQYQRLGMVTGNGGRQTIRIPASRIPTGSQLQFVAKPIGGAQVTSTGPVNVGPGNTVQFRIGTSPALTQVYVR